MRCWLKRLFGCCEKPSRILVVLSARVSEQVAAPTKTPQHQKRPLRGEVTMANEITSTQKINFKVKAVRDGKGNPVTLDGIPEWHTDNSDLLALAPAPDGLSCYVSAVGPIGEATVQMVADGKLGEGVKPVIATAAVKVVAGDAAVIELEADAPVEQ